VLPRAVDQARDTAAALRERGAIPVILPMIEITAPPDTARLSRAVAEMSRYDWVLFTSANAVEQVRLELLRLGGDARAFGAAKVGVVGPKTAEALLRLGIKADAVAQEFVGEGLAGAVLAEGVPRRVLLLRALSARDVLPDALRARGSEVDIVVAYETKSLQSSGEGLAARIAAGTADAILFTSSSTVTSTLEALGTEARELLGRIAVCSIGPVTTRSLESAGLKPTVAASVYTVEGLLDALEEWWTPSASDRDFFTGRSEGQKGE
jgi:uroporphyrinogen III methyltransferase/synthase